MGVFIICWLPFFIYNVITGIFKASLSKSHEFIYSIVTWFGYINSGCNPIIYAFSSRDFRRAFSKILCPKAFLLKNKRLYMTSGPSYATTMHHDLSNNAINPNKKNPANKVPPCTTCQMYENSLFSLTTKVNTTNEAAPLNSLRKSETSPVLSAAVPPFPFSPDIDEMTLTDINRNEEITLTGNNTRPFELIRHNLVKLECLASDSNCLQENSAFSISAFDANKRDSQTGKRFATIAKKLRITIRNALSQGDRPSKIARFNESANISGNNNESSKRRLSSSSLTSSISLTVLNKIHASKNGLKKKKIQLTQNLVSEELNSLSNISVNSFSNASAHFSSYKGKHKLISVGTTYKFKQAKHVNPQEKESSSTSLHMSSSKKQNSQSDGESKVLSVKQVHLT